MLWCAVARQLIQFFSTFLRWESAVSNFFSCFSFSFHRTKPVRKVNTVCALLTAHPTGFRFSSALVGCLQNILLSFLILLRPKPFGLPCFAQAMLYTERYVAFFPCLQRKMLHHYCRAPLPADCKLYRTYYFSPHFVTSRTLFTFPYIPIQPFPFYLVRFVLYFFCLLTRRVSFSSAQFCGEDRWQETGNTEWFSNLYQPPTPIQPQKLFFSC